MSAKKLMSANEGWRKGVFEWIGEVSKEMLMNFAGGNKKSVRKQKKKNNNNKKTLRYNQASEWAAYK